MASLTPVNGQSSAIVAQTEMPPALSVGETIAENLMNSLEADLRLASADRNLESTRRRLATMRERCNALVDELGQNYSPDEAMAAELYIEGLREQLLDCYRAVNPTVANTENGNKRLTSLVDQMIDGWLNQLKRLKPEPGSDPTPSAPKARRKS